MADQDYRTRFKTGAEVLHKLLEDQSSPVSDQFLRWKLWLNWKDIVGETIASNAEPVSYRHGILWLWVKHSVWMHQYSFMLEPIKKTINEKFKKDFVIEVKLTLDRRQTPTQQNVQFKNNLNRFIKK